MSEPFLSVKHAVEPDEALAAAMDIDTEVSQIANGKRKPGKLSLNKLAIVLSFVRGAVHAQHVKDGRVRRPQDDEAWNCEDQS